jgi:hypothetical protein
MCFLGVAFTRGFVAQIYYLYALRIHGPTVLKGCRGVLPGRDYFYLHRSGRIPCTFLGWVPDFSMMLSRMPQ